MNADLDTLAKTIYGEARSESFDGKLAVAFVVVNRSKLRGISPREVCLQPWQFSCWNLVDPNLPVLAKISAEDPGLLVCMAAALTALTHAVTDPTGGATNYHTVAKPVSVANWPPSWANASTMVPTTRIGAHQFYRED